MARQNFQHGKRQRELAKKQKKEEKLQRKMERKNNPDGTEMIEGSEEVNPLGQEEQDGEDGEEASEAASEPEPRP